MGDRANIKFIDSTWPSDEGVHLYAHYSGYRIHEVAATGVAATVKAGRATDGIYGTRIAVQRILTKYNPDEGEYGWGLSHKIGDGEYNVIVVDWGTQTVWREATGSTAPIPFAEFVANPALLSEESH